MPNSSPKPKLHWLQFSLRKFFVLVTLLTVLAVGFWRFREWGRKLWQQHYTVELIFTPNKANVRLSEEFERKYWLPMKVYELTSSSSQRERTYLRE